MARAIPTGSVVEKLKLTPGGAGSSSIKKAFAEAGATSPSLSQLLNLVAPEVLFLTKGPIKAGDVKASANLFMASNGDFLLEVPLHDSGILYGDDFTVVVALNKLGPGNVAFAIEKKGTLEPHDDKVAREKGRSQWLVDNWDVASSSDLWIRLTTKWDFDVGDALTILFVVGGVALGGYQKAKGKECNWIRREDGAVICEFQ